MVVSPAAAPAAAPATEPRAAAPWRRARREGPIRSRLSRPRLGFSALHAGDFRWLGAGMLLSSVGMMGEVVALGWLALTLTDSPFMVGVAMGARALPLFFVGVPAGALADHFSRRHLLIAAGAGQAATAAAMGLLALFGFASLANLVGLTLAAGAFRGIEHAARQSYAHDVVGAASLVSGLAVLGVLMRAGWLLGSLGVGAMIARWGTGPAYLAVAGSYLVGAAALLPASTGARATTGTGGSLWGSIVDFVVLVRETARFRPHGPHRRRRGLRLLPPGSLAQPGPRRHAHRTRRAWRPERGALGGRHRRPRRGDARHREERGRIIRGGPRVLRRECRRSRARSLCDGLRRGVARADCRHPAAGALADLLAQSLLQLAVPAHLRGRAGGAWVVAIGLAPLGQLQIGALASLFGVSVALGGTGLPSSEQRS